MAHFKKSLCTLGLQGLEPITHSVLKNGPVVWLAEEYSRCIKHTTDETNQHSQ